MSDTTNKEIRKTPLWDVTLLAWKDMVRILFKPARWGVWWRLCFLALVAGCLTSSIDLTFQKDWNIPWSFNDRAPAVQSEMAEEGGQESPTYSDKDESSPLTYYDLLDARDRVYMIFRAYKGRMIFSAMILFGLWVIFLWLNSRCLLMFVDALVRKRIHLIKGFARVREEGNQVFLFQLGMSLVSCVFVIVVGWLFYKRFDALYAQVPEQPIAVFMAEHTPGLLYSAVLLVSGVLLVVGLGFVLYVWFVDFVIPIVYHTQKSVLYAWVQWFGFLRRQGFECLKYVLWRMVLSVIVGACSAALLVMITIGVVLLTAIVFGIGWLLYLVLPWLKGLYIMLGVALLIAAVVAEVSLVLLSFLPAAVLVRYFSLRYLTALDWDYKFFGAQKVRR